ncbi:hypothetical protein BH18ACT2_BH18ACT2_10040 [soil metagenome]
MDDPTPSAYAVTIAATEHFTLQTARAATVTESNGRAAGTLRPFLTAAGMVEVLNAALAGAFVVFVAFAVSTIDRDQAVLAIVAGLVVGALLLTVLHRAQRRVWTRATGDTTQ